MERADTRCLTPAKVESVGGQSVALWKARPEPEKMSLQAPKVLAITVVSLGAVMALSRWILARIAVGDDLPVKVFAGVVMASPLIIFALILLKKRKPRAEMEPTVPSCSDLPRAVPVRVSLSTGSSFRGGSDGWLSIEDGLLRFRGEYFDFALRPEDFKKPTDLLAQFDQGGAALSTPVGISPQYLRIRFLARDGERWIQLPDGKARFQRDLEAWKSVGIECPSVFPPLRHSQTPIQLQGLFLSFGGVGLALGLTFWLLPVILNVAIFEGRSPLVPAIAVFLLMLSIPLGLSSIAGSSGKRYDEEVEKVLAGERKGMATRSE